jgi:O-antigen/teichoic acid export membrane protein
VLTLGQAASKLASFAFYVVMARRLGQEGFGSFTFALSLALLLTAYSAFGTDAVLSRAVARRADAVHDLFWNTIAVKLAFGALGVGAAIAVATLGDYGASVRAAVALLSAAVLVEIVAKTLYATFQGTFDLVPTAQSMLVQRTATAAAGITALVLGAGLVTVSLIYLGGAILGLAYAASALRRRGIRPRMSVGVRPAGRLVSTSYSIGLASVFGTILFRADATILSLMKGNAAVGVYGAGYRLLESTLFLGYNLVTAAYPAMSRLGRDSKPTIGEAYEATLKALVVIFLPIGAALALFATPITTLVYGDGFDEATTAVRLLGAAAALYPVSYLSGYVLASQDRQRLIPWITGAVALENVGLNLVVIPHYSYNGAAAVTSVSELTHAVAFVVVAMTVTGPVSARRIVTGPAAGAGAMGLTALLVGRDLAALAVAVAAYASVLLAVERWRHPRDVRAAAGLLRGRSPAPAVAAGPAQAAVVPPTRELD